MRRLLSALLLILCWTHRLGAQMTGVGPVTWGMTRAEVQARLGPPTRASGPSATGVTSLLYGSVPLYGSHARVVITLKADLGVTEAVVFLPLSRPDASSAECRNAFARMIPILAALAGPKVNPAVIDETSGASAPPLCGPAERHARLSAEWVDLTGATAALSVAPEFDAIMIVLDAPTYVIER